MMKTSCNICDSKIRVHDKEIILNKYNVTYYICEYCGFIQTEHPYWLEESYSKAIARADTGAALRNLNNVSDLLFFMKFTKNSSCLDFGGGHGILTRLMRDYGFNFFHYDKYAENLFASGFEGTLDRKYDIITSFENFEHFANPMEEIKMILNMTDVLYFSTHLVADKAPLIKDWWYYSPSTGQHIAFYTKKSLDIIAKKHNFFLLTDNTTHILSRHEFNKKYFRYHRYYNKIVNKLDIRKYFKKNSLTWDDHLKIAEENNRT